MSTIRKYFSPDFKQHILQQYIPKEYGHGFEALAKQFDVPGGHSTIRRWYIEWNGNEQSLKHKKGAGRPKILTDSQINTHVLNYTRSKNQKHKAIRYRDVMDRVRKFSRKQVSLRTIQRYGKELEIKKKKTIKRTEVECKQF
jgi:transposase-like protein